MGGGHFDESNSIRIREFSRGSSRSFGYIPESSIPKERKVHAALNPKNCIRECRDNPDHPLTTPIVPGMDVTESRGDDVRVMFKKLPRFIGQIFLRGYVPDPTISCCAIGDATCDLAPLQVGQFEADSRLDAVLTEQIWAEKGGGGTGQESYELAAYYYANKVMLDCLARGKKGYFFFTADESPYPKLSKAEVKRIIGDTLQSDVPTAEVFADLQKKFETYLIYIKKPWAQRKKSVDAEIEQRVKKAGGMYDGVDVRFSLLWHDRNDLDIHVRTPSGEHIYYSNKQADGGYLDVDKNVNGETTKPVENVRWKKGSAPKGNYEVWVERYRFHEPIDLDSPFKVEICIGNQVESYEGVIPAGRTHGDSRVTVGEYHYDPNQMAPAETEADDQYAAYQDHVVIGEWAKLLPEENILVIKDPKAIIDTMLGVLALKGGTRTLEQFLIELKEDDQTDERIADVSEALKLLAQSCSQTKVGVTAVKRSGTLKKRGSGKLINLD